MTREIKRNSQYRKDRYWADADFRERVKRNHRQYASNQAHETPRLNPDVLRTPELAVRIGITDRQVYWLIQKGIIPDGRTAKRRSGSYHFFTREQVAIIEEAFTKGAVPACATAKRMECRFDLDLVKSYIRDNWPV